MDVFLTVLDYDAFVVFIDLDTEEVVDGGIVVSINDDVVDSALNIIIAEEAVGV